MVRDLLAGKFSGAARQFGQSLLNNVDAFLPGDWLPNDLARPEDYTSGHELLNQYGIDPGDNILGKGLGFAVDVATDPLTYVPGGIIKSGATKLGTLAAEGAAKVVGRDALEAAGRNIRSTFGAQRLSEPIAGAVAKSRATASGVGQAQIKALDELLAGTTPEQQDLLGEIGLNIKKRDGIATMVDPTESLSVRDRAAAHLAGRPDADQLANVADELNNFSRRQFESGRDELGIFSDGHGVEDYFPRQFKGVKAGEVAEDAFGRPSAVKGRSLEKTQDAVDFLNTNPEVTLETNAQRALGARGQQQGALAGKADLGKSLVGDEFRYADDASRAKAAEAIKALPPEEREVAEGIWNGIPPRGGVASILSKGNKAFKSYATAGYLIPKMGFQTKNRMSTIWQTYSNPATRAETMGMVKRFASDLLGGVTDGFGIAAKDKLGQTIEAWDDALKSSGGSYKQALEKMSAADPNVAELIKHGVMDGFVSSEEMLSAAKNSGLLGKFDKMARWPSKITQGVESRARLGLGLDLLKSGETPSEAAKLVRDTLFDYSVSSAKNRAYRDAVPFGAYAAQAIPQQAKLLAEKPYLASALANALPSDDGDPTYPYMDGKLNIPLGDHQFISGLGLPFESLSAIPNPSADIRQFGRQVEQGTVGSLQPLLKTAYSIVSGRDPFFGSQYGGYSKLPGNIEGGDAGRLYNEVAGAGLPLITPIDQLARTIGKGTDDRRGLGLKALDLLSGANLVTVDPDRAIQQRVDNALDSDPSVLKVSTPINTSGDADTQALIDELRAVKKRIKDKRMADMAKGDIS